MIMSVQLSRDLERERGFFAKMNKKFDFVLVSRH